jgi:hypothetical protein
MNGQVLIKCSEYLVNIYMRKKYNLSNNSDVVCTIDTDSLIFENSYLGIDINNYTDDDIQKAMDVSKEVENFINKLASKFSNKLFFKNKNFDTDILYVKNEFIGISALFTAPKCYAIHIVSEDGFRTDKLHSRGIALRRSDYNDITKIVMAKSLNDYILKDKGKNETDKYILSEIKKMKEYNISEIAIPSSVKNFASYTKNMPINLRAAMNYNELIAENQMDKIIYGKIKYIYVRNIIKDGKTYNDEKYHVICYPVDSPKYSEILKDMIVIDWNLMKEKLIINPIKILYDALGWNTDSLYIENTTFSLFKKK